MRITVSNLVGELVHVTDIAGKPSEVLIAAQEMGLTPEPVVQYVPVPVPVAIPPEDLTVRVDGTIAHERLQFLGNNSVIPTGQVSSTARKGDKWFNKVKVGDVVDLTITETDEVFGQAVVVCKEYLTLADVLENAHHNHVANGPKCFNGGPGPRAVLYDELRAAYGELNAADEYTVLHILPISETMGYEQGEVAAHGASSPCGTTPLTA